MGDKNVFDTYPAGSAPVPSGEKYNCAVWDSDSGSLGKENHIDFTGGWGGYVKNHR